MPVRFGHLRQEPPIGVRARCVGGEYHSSMLRTLLDLAIALPFLALFAYMVYCLIRYRDHSPPPSNPYAGGSNTW
jgi:hypothetical protein